MRVHNENKSLLCEVRIYYTNEYSEVRLNLLIWGCGFQASQEMSVLCISSFILYRKLSTICHRHIQRSVSIFICNIAKCCYSICNPSLSPSASLRSAYCNLFIRRCFCQHVRKKNDKLLKNFSRNFILKNFT
jgi:hypothetical protein